MKMHFKFLKSILFPVLLTLGLFTSVKAQVGFNNPNPDSSALIDMKSKDKGLLVPRMTTVDRTNMTLNGKKPANGLLVFDTDQKMFFFYDTITIPNRWVAMNPWTSQGTTNPDIVTATNGNVGIGTTAAPSAKLEVNGTLKTTGTVTAPNYALNAVGNGPIPQGGIIMWSGSVNAIPTGWALCDGTNGTPDLRERFIVGASRNTTDDNTTVTGTPYTKGNTGGLNTVVLNSTQIPSHSHTGTTSSEGQSFQIPTRRDDVDRGGNPPCYFSIDEITTINTTHTHTVNVDDTGQTRNQPFENRPPYFALAFIMKL